MNEHPTIWIPKRRIIEGGDLNCRTQMQGYIKIEAIKADGRRRVLADWFPNLITNYGLNIIGVDSTWLGQCRVGSGSATPAFTDTALQSQVATTTVIQDADTLAQSTEPYYGSGVFVFRFDAGTAAGNLSEVGFGKSTGNLFSRALILDGDGVPTTITVLSDEVLDVTYQLRMYPPLSDVNTTINISGTDYDLVTRASDVTDNTSWGVVNGFQAGIGGTSVVLAYNDVIGAITGSPAGTAANADSVDNASYSNNSLHQDTTITWGLNSANFGEGISSVRVRFGLPGNSFFGAMQFGFTPPIPKTDVAVLSLTMRQSWARKSI